MLGERLGSVETADVRARDGRPGAGRSASFGVRMELARLCVVELDGGRRAYGRPNGCANQPEPEGPSERGERDEHAPAVPVATPRYGHPYREAGDASNDCARAETVERSAPMVAEFDAPY